VEQEAQQDVILVGELVGEEERGWCARRPLRDVLVAVAWDRGLLIDIDTEDIDLPLLEIRRREVLAAEGAPLTRPVCRWPANAERPLNSVLAPDAGSCSQACDALEQECWKVAEQ
jgi:hypothetical protein